MYRTVPYNLPVNMVALMALRRARRWWMMWVFATLDQPRDGFSAPCSPQPYRRAEFWMSDASRAHSNRKPLICAFIVYLQNFLF